MANAEAERVIMEIVMQRDLEVLPEIPAGTTHLICYGNNLTALPALPEGLEVLSCSSNKITALPALPSTLRRIDCGFNRLEALPALPASLIDLNCYSNLITELPELPAGLLTLAVDINKLETLPRLPGHLEYLSASKNNLKVIPKLPETLQVADFKENNLEEPFNSINKRYLDSIRFYPEIDEEVGNLKQFIREVNAANADEEDMQELRVKRSNYPQNVITMEPFEDGETVEVLYSQEQYNELQQGRAVNIKPSMVMKRSSARNLARASANGIIKNPSTREVVAHRELRKIKFLNENVEVGAGAGQEGGKTRRRRQRKQKSQRKKRQTHRRRA